MEFADPEGGGGRGSGPPEIGFPSNNGPDPLKNHEAGAQHSILGHHRHASDETPFK